MGESWQDAYFTSVHGRSMKGLAQRIDGQSKSCVVNRCREYPNRIAEYLLSFGMTEYRAFVAENLHGENEKAGWYELEEMVHNEFSPLNVVILKKIPKVRTGRSALMMKSFPNASQIKG